MRYVVLSFDDARKDFVTNALPILSAHGLKATLNVITDFIGRPNAEMGPLKCCVDRLDIENCIENNIEIANHSSDHTNEKNSILKGKDTLMQMQKRTYGFASPGSCIYEKNIKDYSDLVEDGNAAYIRSGNKLRRDGILRAFIYILAKITKNNYLFYLLNKGNFIDIRKMYDYYPSVTCNADFNSGQMRSLIRRLPDEKAVILMFHSIVKEGESADKWCNSCEDFESLCLYLEELQKRNMIRIVSNMELHDLIVQKCENK